MCSNIIHVDPDTNANTDAGGKAIDLLHLIAVAQKTGAQNCLKVVSYPFILLDWTLDAALKTNK